MHARTRVHDELAEIGYESGVLPGTNNTDDYSEDVTTTPLLNGIVWATGIGMLGLGAVSALVALTPFLALPTLHDLLSPISLLVSDFRIPSSLAVVLFMLGGLSAVVGSLFLPPVYRRVPFRPDGTAGVLATAGIVAVLATAQIACRWLAWS
jgi:hypothetical protein